VHSAFHFPQFRILLTPALGHLEIRHCIPLTYQITYQIRPHQGETGSASGVKQTQQSMKWLIFMQFLQMTFEANDDAQTVSLSRLFQILITRSLKKCCLKSVLTLFLFSFNEWPLVKLKKKYWTWLKISHVQFCRPRWDQLWHVCLLMTINPVFSVWLHKESCGLMLSSLGNRSKRPSLFLSKCPSVIGQNIPLSQNVTCGHGHSKCHCIAVRLESR